MIDCHQHFWLFNEKDYGWMGDNMQAIRKNFLPADLVEVQKTIGFNGSVAVQARQSLDETRWLLGLASQNPVIKGIVGWVDLRSDSVADQLDEFIKHPKFVGVRHVVQDEPDDEFIIRPEFVRGVKLLNKYNLTYDILIFPKHIANASKLVAQCPSQMFVLDHIAKPFVKDKVLSPWDKDIRELARYKNVYCKVSGMVTEADWKNWKPDDLYPYLNVIFDAFGTSRVMIGSDWPVCLVAGEYNKVMNVVINYIKKFSEKEQADILGLNAVKAYRLNS
jgi:L-fuconolactonase